MIDIIKYRSHSFRTYGLNEYKNVLQSGSIYEIEDEEELTGFLMNTVSSLNMIGSAVFAYALNGQIYGAVCSLNEDYYDEENDEYYEEDDEEDIELRTIIEVMTSRKLDDLDFCALLDADYDLCAYGMLVQQSDGKWRAL